MQQLQEIRSRFSRRIRTVAKSADKLRHVMFVCPHVQAPFLLDGRPWNLMSGSFTKVCRETQTLVKIGSLRGNPSRFVVADDMKSPKSIFVRNSFNVALPFISRSSKCTFLHVFSSNLPYTCHMPSPFDRPSNI